MAKEKIRQKIKQTTENTRTANVVYQKLGGVWYAFADMGNEIYFGRVNQKAEGSVKHTDKSTKQNRKNTKSKVKEAA